MEEETHHKRWAIGPLVALLIVQFAVTCGQSNQGRHEYLLKYLNWANYSQVNKGHPEVIVNAIDTRIDSSWQLTESGIEQIRGEFCFYRDRALLLASDAPPPLVGWGNLPKLDTVVARIARPLSPSVKTSAILDWFGNTCLPSKGLVGALGTVSSRNNRGDTSFFHLYFYGIHNSLTGESIVVDTGASLGCKKHPNSFFDSEGNYFYYVLGGKCKRYEIASGRVDTILAGDSPIIPWNDHAIIVYSSKDRCFRLLDEQLKVVAEIEGKIEGHVTSSFMVTDGLYVFGCNYRWMAFPWIPIVDPSILTAFYELDFKRLKLTELYRGAPMNTQLVDAQLLR